MWEKDEQHLDSKIRSPYKWPSDFGQGFKSICVNLLYIFYRLQLTKHSHTWKERKALVGSGNQGE